MIEIKIENGTPSMSIVQLGNKYENMDEQIHFTFEEKYKNYRKFALAYLSTNIKKVNRVLPIHNDILDISNKLTGLSGEWTIYIMSREKSELDLTQDIIDLSPVDGEHVDISNSFTGVVKDNLIDKDSLENEPVDNNIKIVYDQMIALKEFYDEAKKTDFYRGKSNYELAVENGYIGTEQEYIADQRYDHSDEFATLASQIENNATESSQKADEAKEYATQANTSKANAAESARLAKVSEDNALDSANKAKAEADKSDTSATSAQDKLTKVNEAVTSFNSDYSAKIETFNTDYEAKTKAFNDNATLKTNTIDDLYHEANQVISGKVIEAAKHAETATNKAQELSSAVSKVNNFDNVLDTKLTQPYVNNNSELYLNDSDNGSMRNVKFSGSYEQYSTNGYQLFDASKLPSKTLNGATVTNNGDGTFTIEGSGTLSDKFVTLAHTIRGLKVGKLYGKSENVTNPRLFVDLYWENGDWKRSLAFSIQSTQEMDITQEDIDNNCYIKVVIQGISGTTITPGTIKPMLYQDGGGTWEPFTGARPSPNPNYPQEINFTGDLCQNLFNKNTVVSGWVKNDGTIVDNSVSVCSDYIEVEPNVDYYVCGTVGIGRFYTTAIYDENKVFLKNANLPGRSTNGIINTGENAKYLRLNVPNESIDSAMLVKGNVEITNYRPYSDTPLYYIDAISINKNLIDILDTSKHLNNNVLSYDENSLSIPSNAKPFLLLDNLEVGERYTLSYTTVIEHNISASQLLCCISTINSDYSSQGKFIVLVGNGTNKYNVKIKFTAPQEKLYLIGSIYSETITNLQLETGEPSDIEYMSSNRNISLLSLNEPLRALPNEVCDTIENNQIVRRVGKIIFNGSDTESWAINENSGDLARFTIIVNDASVENSNKFLVSHFKYLGTWSGTIAAPGYYTLGDNGFRIVVQSISSIEELNAWLQLNPITVYYELETPIVELLSSSNIDQINLLDTYYPVTNITTNASLTFDYKLNLPSYVNMLKNELAVQKEINYNMQAKQNDLEVMQLESALETQYNLSLMKLGGI